MRCLKIWDNTKNCFERSYFNEIGNFVISDLVGINY